MAVGGQWLAGLPLLLVPSIEGPHVPVLVCPEAEDWWTAVTAKTVGGGEGEKLNPHPQRDSACVVGSLPAGEAWLRYPMREARRTPGRVGRSARGMAVYLCAGSAGRVSQSPQLQA